MSSIRVVIADDHAVLRSGLRMLIEAQADMTVVGEAADGLEVLGVADKVKSDVVILDLSMPGPPGATTIARLVRLDPSPRVLVLTMHDDTAYLQSALQAGASGYVVKKAADVELLRAIRIVHRGGTFVNLTRPGEEATLPPLPLSRREVEVLRLLAQGHTNQEAADRLAVSVKTIETHRKRISDKLGLKGRAELFRFAVESRLIDGGAIPAKE